MLHNRWIAVEVVSYLAALVLVVGTVTMTSLQFSAWCGHLRHATHLNSAG